MFQSGCDTNIYGENVVEGYVNMMKTNDNIDKKIAKRIVSCISSPEDIGYFRILDIGCGIAPLLPHLLDLIRTIREGERTTIEYLGIDRSVEMIKRATSIHKNLSTCDITVSFKQADSMEMCTNKQFGWYNIVIVQNYVHLILDEIDLKDLTKYISKCLSNNGVFYISTKTSVDTVKELSNGVFLVKKNFDKDVTYPRRIFTPETFRDLVYSTFIEEGTYDLDVFTEFDNNTNKFLNVIGRKDTYKLYNKYRYSFGYEQLFVGLQDTLSLCNDVKEYVTDLETMETIRKEGYMIDLYKNNHDLFIILMNAFKTILQELIPGCSPIYMKDKLNMNQIGWRFKLHRDAAAGWIDKMKYKQFVTFGIILSSITSSEQGPTRIAIRQGYTTKTVTGSRDDKTIDETVYSREIGKPLQYLSCYGVPGTYYLFDQYVLHDSNFNLSQKSRDVLFVTFAISEDPDDPLFDSLETAEMFYQQKNVLDKQQILQLYADGYSPSDFIVDSFGKVHLKTNIDN